MIKGRIQLFSAVLDGHDTQPAVANSELGHGKMRFFDRNEITGLVASGQIEDACTLSIFFLHFMQPQNAQA